MLRWAVSTSISLTVLLQANAATISGTISIKKTLTRKSVTSAIPLYSRGVVPRLAVAESEDLLAEERQRVVVYLETESLSDGAQQRMVRATMNQENRQFTPSVVVIPMGGAVTFPNQDPILHNLFSFSPAKAFDLGTYDKGQTRTVTFQKPGIVFVYCHLHPNMLGTVFVTPSRFYAQPGKDGTYSIPDVPSGRYTLVAWHKAVGYFRREIVVPEAGVAGMDFLLPFPAAPGAGR